MSDGLSEEDTFAGTVAGSLIVNPVSFSLTNAIAVIEATIKAVNTQVPAVKNCEYAAVGSAASVSSIPTW